MHNVFKVMTRARKEETMSTNADQSSTSAASRLPRQALIFDT
jgi:hypothetical protein